MRKILTLVMLLSATTAFATDFGAATGDGYHSGPGYVKDRVFDKAFAMQFKPGMTRAYVESVVGFPAVGTGEVNGMLDVGWLGAPGTRFTLYLDKATGKVLYWIVKGPHHNDWIMRPTGKVEKYAL